MFHCLVIAACVVLAQANPAEPKKNPPESAEKGAGQAVPEKPPVPKLLLLPMKISGRALDTGDKSIAGATVYLQATGNGTGIDGLLAEAKTDREGRCKFPDLKIPVPMTRAEPISGITFWSAVDKEAALARRREQLTPQPNVSERASVTNKDGKCTVVVRPGKLRFGYPKNEIEGDAREGLSISSKIKRTALALRHVRDRGHSLVCVLQPPPISPPIGYAESVF